MYLRQLDYNHKRSKVTEPKKKELLIKRVMVGKQNENVKIQKIQGLVH